MHKSAFDNIYDKISGFGELYLNALHFLFVRVLGFLTKPLVFILKNLFRLFGTVLRHIIMLFSPAEQNPAEYEKRVRYGFKNIIKTALSHPLSLPAVIFYYLKKNISGRHFTVKKTVMWLLPIFSICLLLFAFKISDNYDIVLSLSVNGENIGYVASEKDYVKARNTALEILSFGGDGDKKPSLPEAEYSLKLMEINRLSDTDSLVSALLSRSDENLSYACAIFIDGEFLCTVKSESGARAVFHDILESKQGDENAHIVTFAHKIDFVQGLYPESIEAVSPDELYGMLTGGGAEQSSLLKLKILKTEVVNESVDYETVETPSDKLYTGTKKKLSSGTKGLAQVTNLVSYVDGEIQEKQEISRIIAIQPSPERIQVGTKALDELYSVSMGGILVWPTVGAYGINSGYGYRWGKLHAGLDIGMGNAAGTSLGKNVVAAASGTVVTASIHSSYGYYLIIDHGNGMQTLYAHCLANSFMVSPGQTVVAGQPIAQVGATGYATGPHLHFEVRINGNRVNPCPYLGIS